MKLTSILLVAGMIAALPPAAPQAQVRTLGFNPYSQVVLKIRGDGINASGRIPGRSGRLEIQEGPYVGGYKQFMLTRLNLLIRDFNIMDTSQGDLLFRSVGVQLRRTISWWGRDISTPAEMLQGGKYEIDIPIDPSETTGDPLFLASSLVTAADSPRVYGVDDRICERIIGYIDFANHKYYLRLKFRGRIPAPWWAVWSDGITRTLWVSVYGDIPHPVYAKVDPFDPVVEDPVVLEPSDNDDPLEPPEDPFPPTRGVVNPGVGR